MQHVKETHSLGSFPLLDYKERSPPKSEFKQSPVRLNVSPSRPLEENSTILNKPPGRVSPFKGTKSTQSTVEIFSTTPRRIITSKSQSVDRNTLNLDSTTTKTKPEITFSSLKNLAASNLRVNQTPSRMVSGKSHQRLSNSEQPSRLVRPTVSSSLKTSIEQPNTNLLDKLKAKSILKRKISPDTESGSQDSIIEDTDMTTTLNTLRNTGSAKTVMKLLNVEKPKTDGHTLKRRAVSFAKDDTIEVTNEQLMEKMNTILYNQELILQRLTKLEKR